MFKKMKFSRNAVVAFALFAIAMFAVAVDYVADRSYQTAEILQLRTGFMR